jgi:hypothetical protein
MGEERAMVHIRKSIAVSGALLVLAAIAGGCTASATVSPPPGGCALDDSVACDPGTDGWSCPAGTMDIPESANGAAYICSTPTLTADEDLYCCATAVFAPGTCTADDSVAGCAYPSIGFSCAGTDTPDQTDSSLNCSVDQGNGLFCCCTNGSC